MTIKQYGSLTLDLNTVKEFKIKNNYEYPEGILINNKWNKGNLLEPTLILSLYDENIVTINDKWSSQFIQDYQEFTLNKRLIVIKNVFDFVFDSNIKVISEGLNFKNKFDIGYIKFDYLNLVINKEGFFWGDNFKGKLTEFNIKTNEEHIWLRYAKQINQTYLDSLVDPVKLANQVLKSRKLDKEWVAQRNIKGKELVLASNKERLSFYPSNAPGKLTIWAGISWKHYLEGDVSMDYPTTNSEWIKVIEFALDKYYELLKQSNEVDLKLMLDKALKDNDLVAENISIFYYEKKLYINVSISKNKSIQWVKSLNDAVNVYLFNLNSKEAFLSYSKTNVTDWQTIFSNSLAQYKQLDKSRQPKLTEVALINCLENTIKLSVNGVFSTNSSLIGSLRVTWNDVIIEWILKEESVEVYWVNKYPLFEGAYSKPTNLNEWEKLFKETFSRVTATIQKIEIHNILFHGACYKKEPTLIDLIKKAFPSYNLHKSYTSESGNFIYYGCHKSLSLEVAYNPKLNVIELFTVKERKESGEYYFSKGRDFFTKENLTNYTNWEQWLKDLIKLNQNLKDLEQSPNTVVSAVKQQFQRTKNLVSDNPADLYDLDLLKTKDVWSD